MNKLKSLIKETLKKYNLKSDCGCGCGNTCSTNKPIKEEITSASKIYEIEGIIAIDTNVMFHKQVMSDVRAIKGITVVKDYIYRPSKSSANRGYANLDIKIDPSPFENKNVNEIVNQIIENIKHVKGVRAFKLKSGPTTIEL